MFALKRVLVGVMNTKTYLVLVCFIIPNVFAEECQGKMISDYVCIPQNYDNSNDDSPQEPPYNYINATLMEVQIVKFDDLAEKLTLKMILTMRWLDQRLQVMKEKNKTNSLVLVHDVDHIELWKPIFIIQNLVSTISYPLAGRTSSQLYGVRRRPGNVTSVVSVTNIYATIHCGLYLEKFPFDKQSCIFKVKICTF